MNICEQIKSGTWPVQFKTNGWASGEVNPMIDVIAPDEKTTASVIGNFKQVVKNGELRLHPIIGRLVDNDTQEKMCGSQTPQKKGT